MDRREFIKGVAAAGLVAALGIEVSEAKDRGIPRRKLGRISEKLSIVGLGGIALMGHPQEEANRIVSDAVSRGVNYFDVAPSYGDGEAERIMCPALQPYRNKIFLACKTEKRDKAGAEKALHESLKRLRTDHFDLYQLHGITTAEEVEQAMGSGGAMEAFLAAREKGLIRHIGFSGHSVEAALSIMDKFDFDTVLFPFNWVCFFKGNFGPQVIEAARKKKMGILALKAMAKQPWPEGAEQTYPNCWYQPVSNPEEVSLAIRFTLSEPVTAILPPGDSRLFEMALKVAENYKPLKPEERAKLQAKSEGLTPIFSYPAA